MAAIPDTNPYLKTKVMTAGPAELRLMLFDGALKFAEQGRKGLADKDYERAVRWSHELIWVDVMDVEAHVALAHALRGVGKHAEAAQEWETAVELRPGNVRFRLNLARSYQRAGQPDKARKAAEAVLKRKPDDAQARQLLDELKP